VVREISNKSVILAGDYDAATGLAELVEELGLEVESIIVKHKLCKEVKDIVPEKWKSKMKTDLSERELEDYLNQLPHIYF